MNTFKNEGNQAIPVKVGDEVVMVAPGETYNPEPVQQHAEAPQVQEDPHPAAPLETPSSVDELKEDPEVDSRKAESGKAARNVNYQKESRK